MSPMGKHIRDRFSSFNFMFMISEVFLFFTVIADHATFLYTHQMQAVLLSLLGLASAFWQYLIVRVIDREFSHLRPRNRWIIHLNSHQRIAPTSNHRVKN